MDSTIDSQYLEFVLAEGRYAIPVSSVREVLATASITRLPRTERHMMGVINLRGAVVPVIDLRVWLDLPMPQQGGEASVIVMATAGEEGGPLLGALADSVQAVIEIDPASIQKGGLLSEIHGTGALVGVARHEGNFVAVLDPGFILSSMAA